MNTITQISGNIHPDNKMFDVLIGTLGQLGIHATYPSADDSMLYASDSPLAWRHYDKEVSLYESIASSPFHIVFNDGEITEPVGRQILYAMTKNRPILMTGAPTFSKTLSLFTRDTLLAHMRQFHAINLPELEPSELKTLLGRMTPLDYRLTKQEEALIQSNVKAYFRSLHNRARDIYVKLDESSKSI